MNKGAGRGKPGTKVTITVLHQFTGKREKITITRDVIPLISVRGYRRSDEAGHWAHFVDPGHKIGYIRLNAFQENTGQELDKAGADLLDQGRPGLVLDLRFNPGGLLSTAVNVSDRFLEKGVVVSTRGRAVQSVSYKAHKFGTYKDFPLAVLVNNWSASASEIVAGALKDHGRATLVGSRTYGKGIVQSILPVETGRSAVYLTTARFVGPAGTSFPGT